MLAIFSAFFLRSSPFTTRNFSRMVPCGFTSVVVSRIAGMTRLRNVSSSSIRLFLNGFGNVRRSKSARAELPASSFA